MLNHKSIKYFKMAVNATSYKETDNDIACKCPVCGDSNKKANSKRLHLYNKGNTDTDFVSCFNGGCPVQNKNVYSFLRDFFPNLLQAYKKETFKDTIDNLKQNQTLGDLLSHTKIDPKQIVQEPKPQLFNLTQFFEPLTDDYIAYLNSRSLTPHFGGTWYKGKTNIKISETTYNVKDYLIIPLYCDGMMYGFYSRSIDKKDFITFISSVGYKVWNWYGINKEQPVYIFEAIFDGLSTGLTNIIANLGAKMPAERLKQLKHPVFCLDNDQTGIENSIEYAMAGHRVYIQPQGYPEKDFNELKLNHPELDIQKLINDNIFTGLSAVTRLKTKL